MGTKVKNQHTERGKRIPALKAKGHGPVNGGKIATGVDRSGLTLGDTIPDNDHGAQGARFLGPRHHLPQRGKTLLIGKHLQPFSGSAA
ncbi:MAG: hypothetical protein ABIJ50_14040 [Pseudomonadota bacterium]